MSDDKNSGVDPRFDPAFQRGFDPTIPIEESVPAPVPRKAAVVAPTPAVVPAVPVPVAAPLRTPAAAPAAAARPTAAADARKQDVLVPAEGPPSGEQLAEEPRADVAPELNPSRNPFLLFLGIIAVALVATGIWLFVQSGDAFNSSVVRSQGDFMSLTATIYAAPFIAMLGAATAIGVLFVFAVKYRGRRPH